MLVFKPTALVCKQTIDMIEESAELADQGLDNFVRSTNCEGTLSSWGAVEWNVFPEDIPPVFVCYGFSSNEDF